MKKWILRTFSSGWLILAIFTTLDAVQKREPILTLFMFLHCIIAWQFCERTWETDCDQLGR